MVSCGKSYILQLYRDDNWQTLYLQGVVRLRTVPVIYNGRDHGSHVTVSCIQTRMKHLREDHALIMGRDLYIA